ncbi:MAG: hypothetical protein HGB29_10400 [Chlorobiaceae bacterium]|nr:hypothetical protein [Chlorobiaceae bacterium]NTW75258.1 hypothetical protein [Chlorobiaceae bacterium]
MSKAALSIRWFAVYMYLMGAMLITAPDLVLTTLTFPGTNEVWIRVSGVLVFNSGTFFWFAAPAESVGFFTATVFTRVFVFAAFTSFVLLGLVQPMLVAIGSIDLAGAVWTLRALKIPNGSSR